MAEAAKELDKLTASQPRLLAGYQKLCPDISLFYPAIDQQSSLVNPTLYESESRESISINHWLRK